MEQLSKFNTENEDPSQQTVPIELSLYILGATTTVQNVVVLTNYRRRQLFALSLTIKDKCGKTFFSA